MGKSIYSNAAREVIQLSKAKIILNTSYFDVPLSRLTFIEDLDGFYCNGQEIVYNAEFLCNKIREDDNYVMWLIAHSLIHCIFGHMYFDELTKTNLLEDVYKCTLWNICCDVAVGYVMNETYGIKNYPGDRAAFSNALYDIYHEYKKCTNNPFIADSVYEVALNNANFRAMLLQNQELFHFDNHKFWFKLYSNGEDLDGLNQQNQGDDQQGGPDGISVVVPGSGNSTSNKEGKKQSSSNNKDGEKQEAPGNGNGGKQKAPSNSDSRYFKQPYKNKKMYYNKNTDEQREQWEKDRLRTQINYEDFQNNRAQGSEEGRNKSLFDVPQGEKYNYETFLSKFANFHEVMRINMDEYDNILYTYGLNLYDDIDLPIIEPLEYKDAKVLKNFIIAIDTSGSTYGSVVKDYLETTFGILKKSKSFASNFVIRIIQCDCEIQHIDVITSWNQADDLLKNFNVYGGGGTSFVPVFKYVNNLIKYHEISKLDGLIYFTDGFGEFPRSKPKYKTAFILHSFDDSIYGKNNCHNGQELASIVGCPKWAICYKLDSKEFRNKGNNR